MFEYETITREQAELALEAVKKQFGYQVDAGYPGPTLQEPGQQCNGWAIVWEEGPYQWTYNAFSGGYDDEVFYLAIEAGLSTEVANKTAQVAGVECPEGVFAEPVNHWCLGLYPA